MTAGQGYHLYVIELDPSAPRERSLDPRRASASAIPVYVGESWYPPEVRLQMHLSGQRASWVVKRYGKQLRPDLVGEPGWVLTRPAARLRERELAQELWQRGYVVFGGH